MPQTPRPEVSSHPLIARLFTNGRSQAVRIPRALAFKGVSEVVIRREGERLILEPMRKSWLSFQGLDHDPGDFLTERPDLLPAERVVF